MSAPRLSLLESLEQRCLLSGVTLITHGLGADASGWVQSMAQAIAARPDLTAGNSFLTYRLTVTDPGHTGGALSTSLTQLSGPSLSAAGRSLEILLLLDWSDVAGTILGGYSRPSSDVGDIVASVMAAPGFVPGLGFALTSLPVHLLGHSRGASVVSQIAQDLGRRGCWVDQMTTFDPVPISLYGDPVASASSNIVFYDNYYQMTDSIAIGFPISGAHNVGPLAIPGAYVNFFGNGYHDNTHLYYQGTINTAAGAADYSYSVGDWYGGSQGPRSAIGYYWSRLGGGTRPSDGVGSAWGGSAGRSNVSNDLGTYANIGQISITSPAGVYGLGSTLSATYRYQDVSSAVNIRWYLDVDQNPFSGNETPLTASFITLAATGNSVASAQMGALIPAGLASGSYYLLGRAGDGTTYKFCYASGAITVRNSYLRNAFDSLNGGKVAGWIWNTRTNTPALVQFAIDGTPVRTLYANVTRPDLAGKISVTNVGFSYVLPRMRAGNHTITVTAFASTETVALASYSYRSYSDLFDENFYLTKYPDVAAAVQAGQLPSGAYHYFAAGEFQYRQPSALFDESYFLATNPDVATAVSNHFFASAFMYFMNYGQKENRRPNPYYDERTYRTLNPDVASAVAAGYLASGFEHFSLWGEEAGYKPSAFFDPTYYLSVTAGLSTGVANQTYRSAYDQFLQVGRAAGKQGLSLFDAAYYLGSYTDVAATITAGTYYSAFDAYVRLGQSQKRNPTSTFNELHYIARYPAVAAAVMAHQYRSGFEHYLLVGMGLGYLTT